MKYFSDPVNPRVIRSPTSGKFCFSHLIEKCTFSMLTPLIKCPKLTQEVKWQYLSKSIVTELPVQLLN